VLRKDEIMATDTRWLKPWLGVLIVAALVAALGGSAMMGTGMMGPGMMWGYGSSGVMDGWGMALGMLAMLAFWIAFIVGVVLLVRWAAGQAAAPSTSTGTNAPVAILKRRYAAGEIDQPTYERMKQGLGG
jgi:putative membrane protein